MTNYEMAEKLSEKMGVSLEEARDALEACDWDMLDAALMLEKEHGGAQATYSTRQEASDEPQGESQRGKNHVIKKIGRVIRRIIACGNRNRFEVRRKGTDELVLDLPVTVMVLLLIVAFWVCVPLLIVGLFVGYHYSFSGNELGRESINRAMDKAAAAADRVAEEIRIDED